MNLKSTACSIHAAKPLLDEQGEQILSTLQLSRYIKYADYLLARAFTERLMPKGWSIRHLSDADRQNELYLTMQIMFREDFIQRKDLIPGETISDLEKVYTNWDRFKQYHIKYSGLLVTRPELEVSEEDDAQVLDDTEEVDDEEIREFIRNLDRTGNDQSTYEIADSEVRTLFRMIPKVSYDPETGDVEEINDANGLPVMADSGSMFIHFVNQLSGINNEREFEDRLLSEQMRRQFPEVIRLQQLIGLGTPKKSPDQLLLFNKFYNTFTRPKVQIWLAEMRTSESGKKFRFFEAIKGNLGKIEGSFSNNFLHKDIREDLLKNYTEIDNSTNPENGAQVGFGRLRLTAVPDIPLIDFSEVAYRDLTTLLRGHLDVLELMGIKFTGINLLEGKEKEDFARMINRTTTALANSLKSRIEAGQKIYNPINDLKKSFGSIKSDKKYIDELVAWESKYSRIVPSLSMRNASNERQYQVTNHNHITLSIDYLNRAKTIDELYTFPPFTNLKYNPLFQYSYLRNYLFDKNSKKIQDRKITVNNYNGISFVGDIKLNRVTKGLSARQKFIMDFNAYIHDSAIDIMRTEAKSSFFSLFLEESGTNQKYIPFTEFFSGFTNGQFGDRIMSYLQGEVDRIKSYPKKLKENPSLTSAYGEFSIFSFLSPDLKTKIINGKHTRADVLAEVERYLASKFTEIRAFAGREGIKEDDLFQEDTLPAEYYQGNKLTQNAKDSLIRTFIANVFTNNIETSIFVTGDPLFALKDFHKRLGGIISNGTPVNTTSEFRSYSANSAYEKSFKAKYSLGNILGVQPRDNTETYLSAVIPDIETEDHAYNDASDVIEGIKKSYKARGEMEITDEEINQLLGKRKITITDGAAFVTLDFHRELSLKVGFHTPELEIAYMYQGLVFKQANATLTPSEKEELVRLRNAVTRNPEKYGIPVLKFTYFGPIQNSTVDAKGFDKFAIQPILPTFAKKNPKLDKIQKSMLKAQLGYVKHASGTKLFSRGETKNLDKVNPDILASHLLREQIKTHSEAGTDTTLLTQFLGLLFTNLFDNGKPVNANVGRLFEKYKSLFQDLHDTQRKAVESIGIELDNAGNPVGFNAEKLVDRLNNQIGRQGYSSNIAGALELDEEGKLKFSIEQSGILNQVQDYIFGFLDKTLRRYRIQGTDHVVVTPGYTEKKLKYLKFNENGTEKMEVRVTFNKAHLPLLDMIDPKDESRTIDTVERLNQLLEDENFVKENQKALTVVFGRAPIDSPHSMGVGIIREFFDPTSSAIFQLPEEFIHQSGIDFDIDKEKVYFPYLVDYEISEIERRINQLESEYAELRKYAAEFQDEEDEDENVDRFIANVFKTKMDLDPNTEIADMDEEISEAYREYYKLKNQRVELKVNDILGLFDEVMSLPEMYADIVIPNSAGKIKELALKNGEEIGQSTTLPSRGEVFDYMQNLKVFETFMKAKEMLAMFAKSNTQSQYMAQAGVRLNQNYAFRDINVNVFDPVTNEKIGQETKSVPDKRESLVLLTPAERKKVVENGKIKFGNKYDVNGEIIQYLISQAITSTVDSAKDPHFADLNITWNNVAVAIYLRDIGVPFERVIDFLNNPVLRRYYSLRQQGLKKVAAAQKLMFEMGLYDVTESNVASDLQTYNERLKQGLVIGKAKYDKNTKMYSYSYKKLAAPNYGILKQINLKGSSSKDELKGMKFNTVFDNARVKELKLSTPEDYRYGGKDFKDTLHLLSYFLVTENRVWEVRSLKSLLDTVTSKMNSTVSLNNRDETIRDLLDSNFIDMDELEKLENAFPSVFENSRFIQQSMEKIFPIISDKRVTEHFHALAYDYNKPGNKSKANKRSLPRVAQNDLIYFILQNYAQYEGQSLIEYGAKQIGKNSETTTVGERLGLLRKKPFWPQLVAEYPVLDKFEIDVSDSTHPLYSTYKDGIEYKAIPHNIKFVDTYDVTQAQEEDYIQQIKELISDDFSFQADSRRSEADNKAMSLAISKVVKDLLIASITQAGIGKSQLSYYNLIPPSFVQPILIPAIDKFSNLSIQEKDRTLDNFRMLFKENNPKYFGINRYATWRGKDYRIMARATEKTDIEGQGKPDIQPECQS